MTHHSRDLDSDDWKLVSHAAKTGCTTKQFAKEMNISEEQVWKFLYSKNGESYLEQFKQNNEKETK
jgi:predicted transcriptional regulator